MRFLVRMLQAIGLAGLIAVMATAAEDQPKLVPNPPGKSVTAAPKSVLQSSPDVASRMARRLAGPGAKTVDKEDVVEGGVYYEDPVSGKLILSEAPNQARSPAIQTFVVQLTGHGWYLPTEAAARGGGYSAVAQSNLVGPAGGQVLVDRTVELMDSLWTIQQ